MSSQSGSRSLASLGAGAQILRAPLVGRGPQLRELEEALTDATEKGQPQTVTILGAAGIGKTRLLHEFLSNVRKRERVQTFRGTSRENGPAYGVVQRILRARFGIIEGADKATIEGTLRDTLSDVLGDVRVDEFLYFLGAYLDLSLPASPLVDAMQSDERKRVSRAVLRRFFEADAQRRPLVLTFEDLHFAHDESLDLIEYLITSLRDAPILLVTVAQPDLLARRLHWADSHRMLDLPPLDAHDAAAMMLKLLEPVGDPPDELIDTAVDIAGGSPYLLEQMVRAFFDSGTLVADDKGWNVSLDRLAEAQLPLTVEDAIRARIASVSPRERDLLERAATMGGVFWLGALVALGRTGKSTPDLWGGRKSEETHYEQILASLEERDYVLKLPDSSIPNQVEFAFKHNLEREAIHRLTNRARSRSYHRVVAEWLEFTLPDRGEEQLEMLAQHCEDGGVPAQAASYWIKAGERARARFANAKAAEYFERGLAHVGDDATLKLTTMHSFGDVLQLAGRNEEALHAFRQMLEIAFRLDQKDKGGAAHNRIGRLHMTVGRLDEAMRHLGTAHALFDASGDAAGVASASDDIGRVHWMRGDYDAADRFMRRALEMRREQGERRSLALSLNNLGIVCQDSGKFAEALECFHQALQLRREIEDQPGIAQTLNNLGTIHSDAGKHARAMELFEESLEMVRVVGDRMREAVVLINLGESLYRVGRPAEAIKLLKEAEEISASLGDRIIEGEVLRGLSKAHMLVHDYSVARDYIARSIELFEEARGKPFLGVALRTAGEIAAAAGWGGDDHSRAKDHFEKSVELFEELGNDIELARSLEAYAKFMELAPDNQTDPVIVHQVMALRARADEIRQRLKKSEDVDLGPLPDDKTDPEMKYPLPTLED